MKSYKAYKFRLYPTEQQKEIIHKTFRCSRFVYNHYLQIQKETGIKNAYDLCKDLKDFTNKNVFLKEVDSCALRCAIFNLENAYKNYFSKRSGYPNFKSKFSKQSYRTNCVKSTYKGKEYPNIMINLVEKKIKLPKLGLVSIRGYRKKEKIDGRIIHATVTKESTNRYYVSVVVEEEQQIKEKIVPKTIVGLDLGVKDLVITSDGEKYDNEKIMMKYEKRIKKMQRELSRKKNGSKNYFKNKEKLARLYSKLRNHRKHYLNKIANEIVNNHDIVVTENLQVKKMTNHNQFAKYILDASFNALSIMLEWKCKIRGKYYYKINPYYPSSQICSVCGYQNEKVKDLEIREYKCPNCQCFHDRDINASMNIMFEGLKLHYKK